ncbi:MAG: prolipoprotein diacylglyceryl transferase [Microthrixaceae bacterium]
MALAPAVAAAPFTAAIPSPSFQDLTIGPLSFRMYGLCIALGVLAAVVIARRRWEAWGGDGEDVVSIALGAVPAGLIGARLYHVVTDWSDRYSGGRWWPDAFMVWKGGLGIPGGVLAGVLVGVLIAVRLKIDWRRMADAAAPAIPVAQAIGRLGNWFNQELYGRPTDLPWALRIDAAPGYPPGTTFHPTFLYEGLWNLGLAGLIVLGGRRVVLKPGRWFAVYVAGYGLGRLWVESLRIDEATKILGLRVNIWTALLAIVGGLLWLFWKGSPVDHEATRRLRDGESLADILPVGPSPVTDPGSLTPPTDEVPDVRDEILQGDAPDRLSGEAEVAAEARAARVADHEGDGDGGADGDEDRAQP